MKHQITRSRIPFHSLFYAGIDIPRWQALALILTCGCQEPTQVRLHVKTDVPFERERLIAFTTTSDRSFETIEPNVVVGPEWGPEGELGTLVLIPKSNPNAPLNLRVAMGVTRDPTSCTIESPMGCIISRRKLTFVKHRRIELPIFLHAACDGVACDEDSTCNALGRCVAAQIDPNQCEDLDSPGCLPEGDWNPGLTTEICGNGIDDDANGLIDDGCETTCPCPVGDISWDRIQSPDNLTLGSWEAARSVWTGKEHLFAYVASESEYSDSEKTYELYLARWSNAGVHLSTSLIADVDNQWAKTQGLIWTGQHAVVMADAQANTKMVQVQADGTVVSEVPSPGGNAIIWNGREIGRLTYDSETIFDRLDASLKPLDSPVTLGTLSSTKLGWTGARWLVIGTGEEGRIVFLEGNTIDKEYQVPNTQTSPMVATSGDGALVCMHESVPGNSNTTPVTCQRYSAEGTPVGSVIVIDKGPFSTFSGGIVWWQCAYMVILPGTTTTSPTDTTRIVRILADGTLEDVPLPPADGAGTPSAAGKYAWYFHSSFDAIEYTPGDLFFPTRWFSPYMKSGRLRISCGS